MKLLSIDKFIQSMLVLYLIAWTISPPLQIDTIYRIAALGAAVLWFILNIPYQVKFERIHILAIVFMLLVMFVALIEGKGSLGSVLKPINLYMLVLAFLMAYSYKDRWDELAPLVPIVLIMLTYFNYQTYKIVLNDPAVARLIVRNDPEIYKYMRQGVGGYALLYSQVCILPMVLTWIMGAFKKHWVKFAIGVIWLVSYTQYLLNSGYTIAVVTSIAGLIILFFYKKKSVAPAILIVSVLIVVLVWLIGYVDGFRNALLDFFDGTTVAKKINDIYLSITTDETADSIMVRIERYKAALQTMITYPFIGGLWFEGGSGGGHSALLDNFAKYGIFGGYVFINIIFEFTNSLKKKLDSFKDIQLANALFISIFLIVLLNAMPHNLVLLIILGLPMFNSDIIKWREENESIMDS